MGREIAFEDLTIEAMRARSQFSGLPEEVVFEVAAGVSQVVIELEQAANSRWNSIGFDNSRIIIHGSIRDVVFMIQAGVNNLDELREFRSRVQRTIAGPAGREFHTNPTGPPNTQRTTLRNR